MKVLKILFLELGKAFLVGNAIFAVFLVIYFVQGAHLSFDEKMWEGYLVNLSYSMSIYLVNAFMFIYFSFRFKKEFFKPKNLGITITLSIFLSLATIFLIRFLWAYKNEGWNLAQFVQSEEISFYYVSLVITIVTGGIFYIVNFYKHRQQNKVKASQIIAGAASAQYESLKNQLDPHFLFNSLNVLSSLIEENPSKAQKFTTNLSKVYRYVLEQKSKELVSLEEELKFARTYAELLKMRFEDGLVFNLPTQINNPEAKVAPLALQLLLENAIKHNRVGEKTPLIITIIEDKDLLIIENNLQVKENLKEGSGVGLRNITERYKILTDRTVEIIKSNTSFKVTLPLLTQLIESSKHNNFAEFQNTESRIYSRVKKQVRLEKEFHGNLISYIIIIPFLALVNYVTVDFPWVLFPMFGWGIGLFFHAMTVYEWNPLFSKEWEEKKIRQIMKKMNNQENQ
ncbi:histidine kinase [Gramella sp. AN32]|uniref:Histidine kinase n=1 Tax=Christiangramia antarctica TaxID=2058158 RepID=A0ABW5X9K1_9FLAO|nr:histidine kinase [Gramella sp. AN32]MCM4156575.1 histidine kinase [Gramella sp. AN32]